MKKIKEAVLLLFILILLLPLCAFNWEPDAVSAIDNRRLAANPFTGGTDREERDLTDDIEAFVSDRLGLRDQMILGYTLLNDRVFGKMVHPSYTYGKEGYVFFKIPQNWTYSKYHEDFADLVKQMEDYCKERSTPFLFVLNPSKMSVLSEYLPEGVCYDNRWIGQFLSALDERGVTYISNMELLKEKAEAGEFVFNRKYDAGHWNALGAFYGVNHILSALHENVPAISVNIRSEFDISETLQTSLPVSEFPIREMTPVFSLKQETEDRTGEYWDEVERDASYQAFGYRVNPKRLQEGAPRALVFQGSYMNGQGNIFLQNALGEYIFVHDYQNVMNLPYYYNLFQPDCVVFEAAEYTLTDAYFDWERMKAVDFNPPLRRIIQEAGERGKIENSRLTDLRAEQGKTLTKLTWSGDPKAEYVWLALGEYEYDFIEREPGVYEAAVENSSWDSLKSDIRVAELKDGFLKIYK
ncbi:hypothetical protein D3Z50_07275 [Clostridiaceae bacterium]|nr:hypothetical protein [Clostridiaceae bacterium]